MTISADGKRGRVMSILIKGMDKPTDCGLCPFEDFGYCNAKGERNTSENGVDDDCPLIEVADRKDDPQTFDKPPKCLGCLYSDLDKAFHPCASCVDFGKYVGEVSGKGEPQKICKYCNGKCSWWVDGDCMNDDCRFKPKDEPQTERSE